MTGDPILPPRRYRVVAVSPVLRFPTQAGDLAAAQDLARDALLSWLGDRFSEPGCLSLAPVVDATGAHASVALPSGGTEEFCCRIEEVS